MKALVVEDDPELAHLLTQERRAAGFTVVIKSDGLADGQARTQLLGGHYLSRCLPLVPGRGLCCQSHV